MFVSSVQRSALIQFVSIELVAAQVPTFEHPLERSLPRSLLFGREVRLPGSIGTRRATGLPRRVITKLSPASTARTNLANC
jgi:hypothetical protein